MKTPLYKKLADEIRSGIYSGTLRPGEKLPSKRALAEEKKLSLMTVVGALELLEAEGLICSMERRGYFVAKGAVALSPEKLRPRGEAPKKSSGKDSGGKTEIFDFRSSGTAVEGFPFYTWAKLMRETLSEKDTKLLAAIDPKGVYELRLEISRKLALLRGINCEPSQIIIGAGIEYLLGLVYQLLGRRAYAFESPGYTKAAKIYSKLGAGLTFLPGDSEGVRADLLEDSGIEVVQVTPSHSFPLGVVMSPERRRELISWVSSGEGRFIIEDDFDSEFRYSGPSFPSLYSLDRSDRVIYMNTFTRTLAPSMRIGYMVLPPGLTRKFDAEMNFCSSTVPALEQYVLARFIADGSFERHLSRMRRIYKSRRDVLCGELERFGERIEVMGTEAGVHIIVRLKDGLSESEVVKKTARMGIHVAGISEYTMPGTPPGAIRNAIVMNFAGIDEDSIRRAFEVFDLQGDNV